MKAIHQLRLTCAFPRLLLVLCALLLASADRAGAATLVVTNLADIGPGTLRETITNASSGDTITFAVTGIITLTNGELRVDKDLTIHGPGASSLTISGNNSSRVFNVTNAVVASISGLTITRGRTTNSGGGILNAGTLELRDCVLTNNAAGITDGSGHGGGIAASGPWLTVERCVFSTNSATGNGGAIRSASPLVVNNCIFRNNVADYYGGGIYNYNSGQIKGCTFDGNSAGRSYGGAGGGIWNEVNPISINASAFIGNTASNNSGAARVGGAIANRSGSVTISSSTLSGNNAASGGGIYNGVQLGAASTLTITSSTIVSNSGTGGGVYGASGTARFRNTILAGNTSPSGGAGSDCISTNVISLGYNLVGNSSGSVGFTNGINFDQVGNATSPLNPGLGPLQDNGGPTWTHALWPGSPALDMGHSSGLSTDQGGGARPILSTTNTSPGDGSDIGAFEAGGYVRLTSITHTHTNSTTHLQFMKDATTAPVPVYHIQRCATLGAGDWADLPGPVESTNTLVHFLDTTATNAQSFYRVRLPSKQVWGTILFRDDFNGATGSPNPAAWIVNHPESSWWVQGRTFFPSTNHHPDAPFPRVSDGKCVIEHHLFNSYDNAETNITFLGGEIRTVMQFNPSNAYRFEARVRCNAYPNGLVTSFFTYGYDGANSDELDFEFLSKQSNDNARWPAGDPVVLNAWNESTMAILRQCPQSVMAAGLDLTAWNTFRIYWYPGLCVYWTWVNPSGSETLLRTEANPCLHGLPDEPMALYFNFWAADAEWPDAYDSALQPVNAPGQNQIHTFEIDYVEVRVP